MTDTTPELTQLQQQQALFTQALKAMLEGKWSAGPDTVEAYLYALDPNMTGTLTLNIPVTESDPKD
ncbi:MAG TPA: hypothetical protein VH593_29205 [Ktedonobacteraceae bacterium]